MFQNLYLLLGTAEGAASGGSGTSGGALSSLAPFALIFLVMYLLIIRPQSKKQKNHRNMLANIGKGEKVISAGGIHGTVVQVNNKTILVKVGDNTKIEFNKESIATIVKDSPQNDSPAEKKPSLFSKAKKETKNETKLEDETISETDSDSKSK